MWIVQYLETSLTGRVVGQGFEIISVARLADSGRNIYLEAELLGAQGSIYLTGNLLGSGTRLTWSNFGIIKKGVPWSSDLSTEANSVGLGAMFEVLREVGQQLWRAGWTYLVLDFDRISGARGAEHLHRQMTFALTASGPVRA